ncbi:4-(cytidine 5'-diphospho)-2-C-methyl-D-erythritol kinase [Phaeovulum sp.]|uniref:4-(cytidine 5'-diphospho)-2-C-methyl-D-erythritol kinase n=1 Tax=Phaeovulum sp. TaxID=2934796 RepID=UPI00356902FB
MAIEEAAPAKVNLTLHITGQRADGYHLLDSLVVFAEVGDRLTFAPSDDLSLAISGPLAAGVPTAGDNLVLRAAAALGGGGVAITLEKHLPMAAGLGGGSSDAAAAMRGLARLWGRALPAVGTVARLGADLPVCLDPRPQRVQGIGEVLSPAPPLPPLWLVLANPGVGLATAAVFAALAEKTGRAMPAALPRCGSAAELATFLRMQRNDLEAPAQQLAPVIGTVLGALAAQSGCLIARMSGSGASCFGLFADPLHAAAAARAISAAHPAWWVRDTALAT